MQAGNTHTHTHTCIHTLSLSLSLTHTHTHTQTSKFTIPDFVNNLLGSFHITATKTIIDQGPDGLTIQVSILCSAHHKHQEQNSSWNTHHISKVKLWNRCKLQTTISHLFVSFLILCLGARWMCAFTPFSEYTSKWVSTVHSMLVCYSHILFYEASP